MSNIKINAEELWEFTIEAKANGWASGKKAEKLADGGRRFVFRKGLYVYKDVYYGSTDFIGNEMIWWKNNPIWGMSYFGTFPNASYEKNVNKVLHEALNQLDDIKHTMVPARGPYEYDSKEKAGYRYLNDPQGHFGKFTGTERVVKSKDRLLFLLWYQGGRI